MRPAILLLDYDGVLHPDEVYRYGSKIVLKVEGMELFGYAHYLEDILGDFPSVRIILSTSWVQSLRYDVAKKWLPEKLRNKVIGATWHSRMFQFQWNELNRYQQILGYVSRHCLTNWVAIDNDGAGWVTHHDHFVHTEDMAGISAPDKQAELRLKLEKFTRN